MRIHNDDGMFNGSTGTMYVRGSGGWDGGGI